MSGDIAKIRLKIGHFEFEYEGEASFLEYQFMDLLEKTLALHSKSIVTTLPAPKEEKPKNVYNEQGDEFDHSTSAIASIIGVKKASDLVIAASANLALVQGKAKFSRADILSEMKGATTFYKKSMASNLSKTLETLVNKKRLNVQDDHTYALAASEKEALETKLAEHR